MSGELLNVAQAAACVPYYDPGVVYGAWPYPDYSPYSWPAPGYIAAGVIATGIAFGAGYGLGRWATGGYRWGGGFNWGGRNINVNRSINVNNVRVNNWSHSPAHRQGVRYNNANVTKNLVRIATSAGRPHAQISAAETASKCCIREAATGGMSAEVLQIA